MTLWIELRLAPQRKVRRQSAQRIIGQPPFFTIAAPQWGHGRQPCRAGGGLGSAEGMRPLGCVWPRRRGSGEVKKVWVREVQQA